MMVYSSAARSLVSSSLIGSDRLASVVGCSRWETTETRTVASRLCDVGSRRQPSPTGLRSSDYINPREFPMISLRHIAHLDHKIFSE